MKCDHEIRQVLEPLPAGIGPPIEYHAQLSIAISLKRIADALSTLPDKLEAIEMSLRKNPNG